MILRDVKASLRVNDGDDDIDMEIMDLIDSAISDLVLSGVSKERADPEDILIKRAIILYCKANFGYEDVNISQRFNDSYVSLKTHLTLSAEYTEVVK